MGAPITDEPELARIVPETMTQWRHKKRGTVYEILTSRVSLECTTAPEIERMFGDGNLIVYRNIATGAVYVRLTDEFMDGRFEQVEPPR